MLQKLQAASRAAKAASADVRQAGAAVVPAVADATAQAVEAGMTRVSSSTSRRRRARRSRPAMKPANGGHDTIRAFKHV